MKKFFLQLLLFFFIIYRSAAQDGALLLSNFKESRDIEDQNWAICQNEDNIMMFANRRGIMTFDGVNWDLIRVPAVPYSVKYNKVTGKVYVGCDNNYGLIEKDERGFYSYISMSGDSAQTGLISNIIFTDSTLFFYSETVISRHNLETGTLEKRFKVEDGLYFTGIIISPKNTFINVMSKGLFRIEADTLFPIVTGYLLENEEVLFSLPYDNKNVLLGFGSGRLSLFDGIKFFDFKVNDEGYIMQNVLSDGILLNDSLYAFSTLDGGAVVVDKKSRKLSATVNYENGLPDDEVFAMGSDNKNGLWISHQFGLTRAALGLPVGSFNIYPGLKGNILNAAWHNNELYVATSEGVFYLTEVKNYSEVMVRVMQEDLPSVRNAEHTPSANDLRKQESPKSRKGLFSKIFGKKSTSEATVKKQPDSIRPAANKPGEPKYVDKRISRLKSINYIYKQIAGLEEKCKQLVSTSSGILVSTNKGLYVIAGHKAKLIAKDQYINSISKQSADNNYYLATSEGYFYVSVASGGWKATFPDRSFKQPLWSITSTNDGNIWAGGNSMVIRIPGKKEVSESEYKTYSLKSSFPEKYVVEDINDTLFLMTETGVYHFDGNSDSFVKYNRADDQAGSTYIYSQPGILWYENRGEWTCISDNIKIADYETALLNVFDDIAAVSISDKYTFIITENNLIYRFLRNKDISIAPDLDLYVKSVTNQDGNFFETTDVTFRRGDNTVYFDLVAPGYIKQNSTQYQYYLEEVMKGWSKWSNSTTITLMPPPGDHTMKVRAKDVWGNISEPKTLRFTIKAPFTKTTGFYVLIFIAIVGLIVLVARFREQQLIKEKTVLEEKVLERTKEIQAQKEEITSSIQYASRIQMAILPVVELFKTHFQDYFILYRPRDIVSGDFYWIGENEKHIFFTVADSTGHGVPGAFMSMLGISSLNEIITNNSELHANTVLNLMRQKIKMALHQTGKEGEATDGMDMAFCILHKDRKSLEFAGAYNPMIIFQNGVLNEYKGDRMPIGIYYGEKDTFTNNKLKVSKGDTIYIFSDGFCDQFGGDKGVKYKLTNLKKILTEIHHKPLSVQRQIINNEFEKWKGSYGQVDDIAMLGVRI